MSRIRRAAAVAAALLVPTLAAAQAVTDPNQIVGEARLTVSNPAILDVLLPLPGRDQGLLSVEVTATSLVPPPLSHVSGGPIAPDGLSAPFDLTVESSLAGIPYSLDGIISLDAGRDTYWMDSETTNPVLPDPAPDVAASLTECMAMLDIRYEFDDGEPLPWGGGRLTASRETAPGSGVFATQARTWSLRPGDSQEYLAVRGGARFDVLIEAQFTIGSDPELDTFSLPLHCRKTVDAACDEMVPVVCVFPRGACVRPPDPLGDIVGVVDVLRNDEVPLIDREGHERTRVRAFDGPLGNGRLTVLRSDPFSGPFQLRNLLPEEVPGYMVMAELGIGSGDDAETITLPVLGLGPNPRVPVRSGETTDLGDTFVVDPCSIRGDVLFAGPPPRANGSLLADVQRSGDPADATNVAGRGLDVLVPGAATTAAGARANTNIAGGMDSAGRNFRGSYDLRVGGLRGDSTTWAADSLTLELGDDNPDPDGWHAESITIVDNAIGPLQADPGGTIVIDRRYCFSEVHLGFRSTTGTFFRPHLTGGGTLTGTDFGGRTVDLAFSTQAEGTPRSAADATDRGTVVMALPQGEWGVSPRVTSLSPRGVESDTELPGVQFPVGCRQVVKLVSQLVPILGTLPECVTTAAATVDGSFRSQDEVVRLQWSLNGGPPNDLCSPCGVSPSFTFGVSWQPCENELFIEAEDSEGRIASVTGYVTLDGDPPTVATDPLTLWPPNHLSWCFEDVSRFFRIADGCPGEPEWTLTSCRSDQPDDVPGASDGPGGDGSTSQDCVLSADGRGFCVRSERLGGCPAGRTYSLGLHVVDGCGNVTDTAVSVRSPHEWDPSLARTVPRPDARVADDRFPFPVIPPVDPDAGLPSPFTCPR